MKYILKDSFTEFLHKLNISLNEQQSAAVFHENGPAVVLAGPGSGKTTVINARIAFLIGEMGVKPDNILTLTFNRASQHDMEHRFKRTYADFIKEEVRFSTFHSFCNRVVRDYERLRGKSLKRIEGEEDSPENKRKILRELYFKANSININDDEMETLINEIGLVKNKMLKELDDEDFITKNLTEIYKAYEDYKKTGLLMDFDDMLTYAYTILSRFPDILDKYRKQYSYIQVDEGQDLSKIQFEILKLLVNKDRNFFIVADDDQSIYGFRGADPKYIMNIEKEFTDLKIYKLENNYRSTKNIVDITSTFIKKNLIRYDKSHKTSNAPRFDPFIAKLNEEEEQIDFIIEKLKSLHQKKKTTAILFRNNLSSIVLVDALEKNKINFSLKQNKLFFFKHWAVLDILAFLRFSLDQSESDSFNRICFKMNRYISKQMLENVSVNGSSTSIIDNILSLNSLKPFQRTKIAELKKEFASMVKMKPVLALDYIEDGFNYFESVKEYCENAGISFDYIYGLFGILRSVAQNCTTIQEFLQRIEKLQSIFETKSAKPDNAVTLTTMHSSKGLEFDCVFLVDLYNNETPGNRAVELSKKGDIDLLEEERRLFYVGMTRAKEYLYMLCPIKRNLTPEPRSMFVNEVLHIMNKGVLDDLGEGVIVQHKKYGEGIIVQIIEQKNDRKILEIDFKGTTKKLDFLTCMEGGLLSFTQ